MIAASAGRPSNRDARHAQVMAAFARCAARFGLEGASLAQIAAEAGLSRPLVRHHLGNRADMIAALKDYVLQGFAGQTEAMVAALPEGGGGALLDLLFSPEAEADAEMILAFAALTARAPDDPELCAACRNSVLEFEAALATVLRKHRPEAPQPLLAQTAHGVAAIYLNAASLAPLNMPYGWRETARAAARALLSKLEDAA